jgi:uncharacterized protein
MRSLSRAAIRHPYRTLAVTLLLTLAAAPGLLRLQLRTDGHALVPHADPAVVYDLKIREELGVRDPVVVVLRSSHPDGIFNASTLRRVRDLTADLRQLDGVAPADLMSLATEPGFRFAPGSLNVLPLLEPLPRTPAEIARLREDLRRLRSYDGLLAGAGGRATAVIIGAPSDGNRDAFYHRVRALAEARAGGRDTVEVLGAPVAESLLGSHILADLGVPPALLGAPDTSLLARHGPGLLPLALAVMALVSWAAFRHPVAVLLPLLMVGCSLVVVFGVMGWLGIPVYLTTVILPVLLIAVSVADQIHILRWYARLRRERPDQDPVEQVRTTMDEMASPVVQTSLTTIVGFLSFALSPLAPVQAFSWFSALGSLACLAWALGTTPAVLVLLRPDLGGSHRPVAGREPGALFRSLARLAVRRRRTVLAATCLLTLAAFDGVRRIAVQDSWIDGFAAESGFSRSMRRFDRDFLGIHILRVIVTAEPVRFAGPVEASGVADRTLTVAASHLPGAMAPERLTGSWVRLQRLPAASREDADWSSWIEGARRDGDRLVLALPLRGGSPRFRLDPRDGERLGYEVDLEPFMAPETLAAIGRLETFLASRPGVGGVRGPANALETVGFLLSPDRPDARSLPEHPLQASSRWSHYARVRGPERMRQLVSPDSSQGAITVFLKGSNYVDTGRLMADLRAYEAEHLLPRGMRLGFAGDVAVSQALIRGVVTTQVRSLLMTLVGILAVTALLGRSLRRGLISVVPPTLAILLNFAAMGWLEVPLGVATSMFAAMTLGIGIDFSIHLLERTQRLRQSGRGVESALGEALAVTGPAITIDTLGVGLGFAVLLLSTVPATARLGGLVALSLLTCFAATLLLVPALLARPEPGAVDSL